MVASKTIHPVLGHNLSKVGYLSDLVTAGSGTYGAMIVDDTFFVDHNVSICPLIRISSNEPSAPGRGPLRTPPFAPRINEPTGNLPGVSLLDRPMLPSELRRALDRLEPNDPARALVQLLEGDEAPVLSAACIQRLLDEIQREKGPPLAHRGPGRDGP